MYTLKLLLLVVLGVTSSLGKQIIQMNNEKCGQFIDITSRLSVDRFEMIKAFILKNGDTQFFRNYDGNNPHYALDTFDLFLGADIGQRNITNDPEISDFNELTIRDASEDVVYYHILVVRKGDIKEGKAWIMEGMSENKVYLIKYHESDVTIDDFVKHVGPYIDAIEKELKIR